MTTAPVSPVVIGYDGSDGARNAILWALRETRPQQPLIPLAVLGSEPPHVPGLAVLTRLPDDAERAARRIVSRWDADSRALDHAVELSFARGHPAQALADEAARSGAELIVIGHRRSRRLRALRASVAEDLVRLAGCPVVVVPE